MVAARTAGAFAWDLSVANVQTAVLVADFLPHFRLRVNVQGRRIIGPLTSLFADDVVTATS